MGKRRNSNDNHERDQDDVIMISDDKFAVFDFNDGDMRVESDSLKALAKFGTQTPDRKPSSRHRSDKYRHRRDKYAFLECFACGNAEEKSGSGNDTSDIEVVENLSENRSLNVGFAASRNSFDCKSPDNTFVKSHDIASCSSGVNSHAQGARNQAARTTNMIHNEILNIDSDDCGVMELRGSIPFDIPNSEGLLDDTLSSKCKMDVNDHGAVVVVNPKYVKWEDMYFTECTMAFSSICIRLEGLNICGERKSYSQEWSACAIMRIEYQHCESVKADVLKLYMKYDAADVDKSLAGTSVNAGSLQLEIVVFDDPQWAEKRERLKSLDMKYESAWEPVVNECFPIKSFDDIIYPQGDPDAVYISRRDIDFLEPRMFINDTIIDFYIKYLFNKIEPQEQHRFYFFNTFFFQKIADLRRDSSMDVVGRKAFQCVQKWTRNVDIFEKDYIFMPVNFSLHWSLIVICHPGLVANVGAKDCNHSLKFPCILHMDSIRGSHRGLENLIKSYLWEEWKIRHTTDDDCIMTKFMTLMFDDPQLPQQENLFDCGLFLLHYVELILEHAMDSTSTADLLESMDENWFLPVEISLKKRDQIRSLICRISEETAVSSSHQSKGANDGYEINDQQLSPCKQQMVPVNQFNSTNLLMEEEALEKQATSPVNIQSWSDSSSTKDIKVFMGSLQTCCRESPMMIDVPNDEDSDHEEMRVDSSASDEDLDACVVEDSEEENEVQCIRSKDCVPSSFYMTSPVGRGLNIHIINDDD